VIALYGGLGTAFFSHDRATMFIGVASAVTGAPVAIPQMVVLSQRTGWREDHHAP
jgi:hypothetical protein